MRESSYNSNSIDSPNNIIFDDFNVEFPELIPGAIMVRMCFNYEFQNFEL